MFILLSASCGIESFPYLFPADSIAGVTADFRHDDRNDPNVFRGYELYYRVYDYDSVESGGSVDSAQILADMNSYFNGSDDFFSVSFDELGESSIPSSIDVGYRRVYISSRGSTIPLIPVNSADADSSFSAYINNPSNDYLELNVLGSTYRLKRNTEKSSEDDFPDFSNYRDDYATSDNDILPSNIPSIPESPGKLVVAFFAVPYGFDSTNFTGIFANGTSEDMTYIGSISYNM